MKKKKVYILLVFLSAGLTGSFFLLKNSNLNFDNKPAIRVLTYSSFAGVYGPGRIIKQEFEKSCDCIVQWFLAEDSTALLQRFLIVPGVDVVIGWDQITMPEDYEDKWENLSFLKTKFFRADIFQNPGFLPLDWSPIGFIYKESFSPPSRLKSLYNIKGQISFPEPKTSTLGLEFYYWIYEVFQGDRKQIAGFLRKMKNKIYGPVFSWSLSYGFFQKGRTDMSLSYLSSLLYHQKEDKNETYSFAYFQEGQPYQLEFLSVSKNSKNKKLALKFAEFMLSRKAQKILQESHYMFPVIKELSPHSLLNLKPIRLISYKRRGEFIKQKKELLNLWQESLY